MSPEEALERGLSELQVQVNAEARDKLLSYVKLLEKWNKTYNLTAIREPLAMVKQHLLDSLAVLPHLPLAGGQRFADVGSGAGLPGIPLAIALPKVQVSLNDANGKKAAFLRHATMALEIRNATVHEGRVEQWRPEQPFDVVISRAFAELRAFLEACKHLVRRGGILAAMKGARTGDEVRAASGLCQKVQVVRLAVPFVDGKRALVLCEPAGL